MGLMPNGNGGRVWAGAAATIIAALTTTVVLLLVNRNPAAASPRVGDMPVAVWELQMKRQTELLEEIRDELRRRP